MIAALSAGALIGVGFAIRQSDPALSGVLLGVGIVALGVVSGFALGARQVFAVALFRHATGQPASAFPAADLEHPFEPRSRRDGRRRRTYLIGLTVFLVILPVFIVVLKGH